MSISLRDQKVSSGGSSSKYSENVCGTQCNDTVKISGLHSSNDDFNVSFTTDYVVQVLREIENESADDNIFLDSLEDSSFAISEKSQIQALARSLWKKRVGVLSRK